MRRRCLSRGLNGATGQPLLFTKKLWRRKFFHGSRKSLRNQMRLSVGRSAVTHGKYCAGRLAGRQHELLARRLLDPTVFRFKLSRLQLVNAHLRKCLQDAPQQYKWVQGFCELCIASMRNDFVRKAFKSFRLCLAFVLDARVPTLNNLMSLGVNISL